MRLLCWVVRGPLKGLSSLQAGHVVLLGKCFCSCTTTNQPHHILLLELSWTCSDPCVPPCTSYSSTHLVLFQVALWKYLDYDKALSSFFSFLSFLSFCPFYSYDKFVEQTLIYITVFGHLSALPHSTTGLWHHQTNTSQHKINENKWSKLI